MELDSINPNTPVDTASSSDGEINKGSGGPVTFDELEEVMGKKSPAKKSESSENKKDEKKEESKPEKRVDLTNDADKSGSKKDEPSKKDSKKEESKPDKQKENDHGAEDKPARKVIKGKFGEQEIDLDDETLIPVSIDGKEEFLTLKELRADRSGRIAWDKKFTEIGKKNKEISAREQKLEESSRAIRQIFEEQDPEIKMYRMSQLAGVDPVEFRKKFLNDNISTLEKYYAMSEDERKSSDLAYEAKVQRHRADTLEKSIQDEQSFTELKTKVDNLRARHEISEDEFATRYEEIASYQDRMAREHGDRYTREPITPELIAESILKNRLWNSADKVISSLGLNEQARVNKLAEITDNAYKMGLTPAQVEELVDDVFGSGKTKRTIQKKKEQVEEFRTGRKDVSQAGSGKSEPMFFDDL